MILPPYTPELLERTIEKVIRQTSDIKIEAYARLFSRYLSSNGGIRFENQVSVIEALDSLTDQDLSVLFYFRTGTVHRIDSIEQELRNSIEGRDLVVLGAVGQSVSKLEARGILAETSMEGTSNIFVGSGPMDAWYNRWRQKRYELIPFGREFLDSIMDREI